MSKQKDTSVNITRIEREEILATLNRMKNGEQIDIKDISKIELNIKNNNYGLNFEKHKESIDYELEKSIPILKEIQGNKIFNQNVKDNNFLIEGDNLYSLNILQKTHKGKLSGILIDPPYNTLKDGFSYSDNKVDKKDGFRHSKWISFMEKRLLIAKELLKEDGLIFINIDEHEFAQLKLLCDSIFGENNFIENFIWIKNSTKNNSTTTSTNHEYILCYAKNIKLIKANSKVFRVQKEGFEEIIKIKNNFLNSDVSKQENSYLVLQDLIRVYYKENPQLKGISSYKYVDKNFNIYASSDMSAPGGSNNNFDIVHPVTKKICKKSNRGWRYCYAEFQRLLLLDKILFGKDERTVPRFKRLLDEVETNVSKSIIINYDDGEKELQNIFNLKKSPFTNPKPTSLIKYLLSLINEPDGIYLDFFAGSGSLGHAVAELNKEDGGNRKFILCTNNEGDNICENVTFERLNRVITGSSYTKETFTTLLEYEFKVSNLKDAVSILETVNRLKKETKDKYDMHEVELIENKLILKGISKHNELKSRLDCNLEYYKIELLSKEKENNSLSLSDDMCIHIKNMVKLENHINLDNSSIVIVLKESDLEELDMLIENNKSITKIYKLDDTLFNKKQELFIDDNNIEVELIPEYYFKGGVLC